MGELEPAILDNVSKLAACDILVYTYDSSDPDSFAHILSVRSTYPHLNDLPALYVALKADNDKTTQRSEIQPEEYTAQQGMPKPLHISVTWGNVSELFVQIAEAAMWPAGAYPKGVEEEVDRTPLWIALGAVVAAGAAFLGIWRRMN